MRYVKWIYWSAPEEEPLLGYLKTGQNNFETEKFQFFADGTWDYSKSQNDAGRTRLGDQPVGSTEENNKSFGKSQPIWMWEITKEEYDAAKKTHIEEAPVT